MQGRALQTISSWVAADLAFPLGLKELEIFGCFSDHFVIRADVVYAY